ncbi:hypothetical protein [Pelagibacterium sediminicola]|uniref:hypothetical protein n=1 Tax=Pelagibacterium sediminicola TaxID=2248761 RepID=UPI000E321713|nr:hypothetical protein [Pelagibacterium sediminicola]
MTIRHIGVTAVMLSGMLYTQAAPAQTLEEHMDCAAAFVLQGTIYPEHQAEAMRRVPIVYQAARQSEPELAGATDDQFNTLTFRLMQDILAETLASGDEDGPLALINLIENCEMAYGLDWLGQPDGMQ